MEQFEYKGRLVDIFTAVKDGRWAWAFSIDAGSAEADRTSGFESASTAIESAKEKAQHLIDEQLRTSR